MADLENGKGGIKVVANRARRRKLRPFHSHFQLRDSFSGKKKELYTQDFICGIINNKTNKKLKLSAQHDLVLVHKQVCVCVCVSAHAWMVITSRKIEYFTRHK